MPLEVLGGSHCASRYGRLLEIPVAVLAGIRRDPDPQGGGVELDRYTVEREGPWYAGNDCEQRGELD